MAKRRRLAGRTAVALALVTAGPLGAIGCTYTQAQSRCDNGFCRVTLQGDGSEVALKSLRATVVLVGVDGDDATIVLRAAGDAATVVLGPGERTEELDLEVVVDQIEGDEVVITVSVADPS